jgi:hypothetical protein
VLIVAIGLREIPDSSLRLIGTAATHDRSAGVFILEFVGPLPNAPDEVQNSTMTCGCMYALCIHFRRGSS